MKTFLSLSRKRLFRGLLWGVALLGAGLIIYGLLPKPELYPVGLRFSRTLEDRRGQMLHLMLTPDEKYRLYTPLDGISTHAVDATLTLEDRHFFTHPGINPLSMMRAAWGVISRSRRGGGSTITMQLARLRFDLQTRSAWGKLVQMARAVQLERHYSKREILEAYLNLAPYGGNVEGLGAASLLWCGRSASELTLREAVALSVLPQSPTRRRPKLGEENPYLAQAQMRLWKTLCEEKGLPLDPLDARFSLRQLRPAPREAPHLARRLALLTRDATLVPPLQSTLDAPRQQTVERALADYIARKREIGINNACALLVHAPSREVLAYVGSTAFLNSGIQGQVDGIQARRSPGSALKPFIYAMAMQEGLIHPHSLLRDGRTAFGEYNPENYDRGFAGPIAAEDALYHSRNIPAVSLAQKLQGSGLYGFLKQAGVALPRPAEHYGLSLPLGGGEVSMEELAGLYALLADDGKARALKFQMGSGAEVPGAKSDPVLLTEAARYLTREMIRTREGEPALDDFAVTWKTGTSHGFRDGWAAGIRGDYVLVVWIGNFNGKTNPAFVARESAAPLMFEVFRKLRLPMRREGVPSEVQSVELCAVSGQLPTACCTHRTQGGFIPGVSPITPCDIHREVWIDTSTQLRVAGNDGRATLKREVFEFWAPDLLEMFRQAGVPRRTPPALETSGSALAAADTQQPPRIVSPKPSLVYTLRQSHERSQSIPLRAETAPGVGRLFWFAGPRFLGSTDPTTAMLWRATPGRWQLHVTDDHGRSAEVAVRVEMVP